MDRVAAEGEASPAPGGAVSSGPIAGLGYSLPARGIDAAALRGAGGGAAQLLYQLQRTAGNQAVGSLLRCASPAHDEDEEEAEHSVESVRGVLARSAPDRAAVRRAADAAILGPLAALQRDDDETAGAVALDSPAAGAAPAGAAASPVFNHSSNTVTIDADSAPDFSNKITATIGTPHTEIVIEPDVQYDFKTGADGKEIESTRKITSVGVTVTTKIVKVRFGMGRPNDKHKKAIEEMVSLIDAHEAQHRAIIESEAKAALAKAQKLVGTNKVKQAFKILDEDLDCAAAKKHEALDAKEGLLTAVEQASGDVTITKSASGAKYPCKGGGKKQ